MFTRRDFSKLALSAVPAVNAMAAVNSKINGVRVGVQSYSFRQMSLDDAIKAMVDCDLHECELFAQHAERAAGAPAGGPGPGGPRPPQAAAGGPPPTSAGGDQKKKGGGFRPNPEARENMRKWRLSVSMDAF